MDPTGRKPTETNKFFMSEKQCGFPRDMKEGWVNVCVCII